MARKLRGSERSALNRNGQVLDTPVMNFDAYVRRHAQVLLDALTSHAATSARTELDELRAVVDRQVAALHKALSHPDQTDLLERLVKDLSGAALKEAEKMATLARR